RLRSSRKTAASRKDQKIASKLAPTGKVYPTLDGRKAAGSGNPLPLLGRCRFPSPCNPLKYGSAQTGTGFAVFMSCNA
ncbi:hypothetical protein, partial [Pseudomonas helleri]|uniref:hypothetical protein n=1 Tax=Pseudomonas helleri TaxID=1608996 RepID=UPI003FD4B6AE